MRSAGERRHFLEEAVKPRSFCHKQLMAAAHPDADASASLKRCIIIDTDAGIDDAQALVCALAGPQDVHVAAICCSFGNAPRFRVVGNVCAVLDAVEEHCGRRARIPVLIGAERPLVGPVGSGASEWHGDDGLGGTGLGEHASRQDVCTSEPYGVTLVRLAEEAVARGEVVDVITLGPLTSLAQAVRSHPTLASLVQRVYVMGGAHSARGNASMTAEFNISEDPEAADVVFGTLPCVMIGWELTCAYPMDNDMLSTWLHDGSPAGRFLSRISAHLVTACVVHGHPFVVPDPLAMAVALRPHLVTRKEAHAVFVETAGRITRGMTVVDWSDAARKTDPTGRRPLCDIVMEVDFPGVLELLYASTR